MEATHCESQRSPYTKRCAGSSVGCHPSLNGAKWDRNENRPRYGCRHPRGHTRRGLAKISRPRQDAVSKRLEAAKQQGNSNPYETAKEAVRDIKKKLPGVLFSGEFSQRGNEHIISHSGLLCLDIDHLEDGASLKLALANDDYVQACFDSPTGSGLKVLVRIEPDVTSHERSFLAAQKYFRDRYSAKVDNCKDLARLCFVSYDENIFIRSEEATLLEPLPPEPKPEAAPPPPRDIDAELTAKHEKSRGYLLDALIADQRAEPDWTLPTEARASGKISTTLTTVNSNLRGRAHNMNSQPGGLHSVLPRARKSEYKVVNVVKLNHHSLAGPKIDQKRPPIWSADCEDSKPRAAPHQPSPQ